MWADRAFQMLHPVQPKRKRECTAQDALKHRRGRRGREGGGFPSLFLGLRLWMAMSTFGTSPGVLWLTQGKGITCGTPEDAQPRWGSLGSCTPSVGLVPPLPGLIPPRMGGGKWKGSACGKAGVPPSALLEGDAPSPGVALRESTDRWGWFLGCLILLGVEQHWKEVRFPAPLPKMQLGAGTSLAHPQLPGGFSVLFLLFFFFFFSLQKKQSKSKRSPSFNKNWQNSTHLSRVLHPA